MHGNLILVTIKQRWKEYFEELYNYPNRVCESIFEQLQDSSDVHPTSTPGVMIKDVERAINVSEGKESARAGQYRSRGNTSSYLGIRFKHYPQFLLRHMEWNIFPDEWKTAVITTAVPITDWQDVILIVWLWLLVLPFAGISLDSCQDHGCLLNWSFHL